MKLLTTKEAAQILRTSVRSLAVARSCRRDSPPFIRIGRKVLYSADDIAAWIEARRVDPRVAREVRQ